MARPRAAEGEKYEAHQVTFPPHLWADLERLVKRGKKAEFIQQAVDRALEPLRVNERLRNLESEAARRKSEAPE